VRTFIDDLPSVDSARLRDSGNITAETKSTVVRLGERNFTLKLVLRRFKQGGAWSLSVCPQCNRPARVLRLLNRQPAPKACCIKQSIRYRVDHLSVVHRAVNRAAKLREMLNSDKPARLHARPGRMLDNRLNLQQAYDAAEMVVRQHEARKLVRALAAKVDK
jgi:hypothetical protein